MRILMVNSSFSGVGGEKTYINKLTLGLTNAGHKVFNLYLSNEDSFESENIKVIKNECKNKIQWFFSENIINYSLYKELRAYILRCNPDIIHIHNTYNASKTILLACRGFKKIQSVHDFGFLCPLCNYKKSNFSFMCEGREVRSIKCFLHGDVKLRTYLLDYVLFSDLWIKKMSLNLLLASSKGLLSALQKNGFSRSVHQPYFTDFKPIIGERKDSKNVLFVGRLDTEKGVDYLIRGFKIAVTQKPQLMLNIVGNGSDKENLMDLTKSLGIQDNVFFVGEVKYEDLANFYRDSFCLVVPSLWEETGPLVAYDSMMFGKPVITSNHAGVADFIENGVNGFLVQKFDSDNMAEKILFLYQNKSRARKMGELSKKIVEEKLTLGVHVKNMLKIYKSVLEKNN